MPKLTYVIVVRGSREDLAPFVEALTSILKEEDQTLVGLSVDPHETMFRIDEEPGGGH